MYRGHRTEMICPELYRELETWWLKPPSPDQSEGEKWSNELSNSGQTKWLIEVQGGNTPSVAWWESRWQHLGRELCTAALRSCKLKGLGSVVTSNSLITPPSLAYRFCSFGGNIFLPGATGISGLRSRRTRGDINSLEWGASSNQIRLCWGLRVVSPVVISESRLRFQSVVSLIWIKRVTWPLRRLVLSPPSSGVQNQVAYCSLVRCPCKQ